MRNTILMIMMMALGTVRVSAQFYTITKETEVMPVFVKKTAVRADNKEETESYTVRKEAKDTLVALVGKYRHNTPVARNSDKSTSLKMPKDISSFPLLTIPNLYEEIRRNGSNTRKSYWHKPSLKPVGSVLRYAATNTTFSD